MMFTARPSQGLVVALSSLCSRTELSVGVVPRAAHLPVMSTAHMWSNQGLTKRRFPRETPRLRFVGEFEVAPAIVERLRAVSLFADLADESLERIANAATEVEVPKGAMLLERGHEGTGLLIIEEGTALVEGPGDKTFNVGPGEFLGELSLLVDGIAHTARVRATSPVRCLAIRRADFTALLEAEPRIALAMLPSLAKRHAQAMGLA